MGATIGAAAVAVVVALGVIAIVSLGGGINRPLVARPAVATPAVAMSAPSQAQG